MKNQENNKKNWAKPTVLALSINKETKKVPDTTEDASQGTNKPKLAS